MISNISQPVNAAVLYSENKNTGNKQPITFDQERQEWRSSSDMLRQWFLAHYFVRIDCFGRYTAEGESFCGKKPLGIELLWHCIGRITIGAYTTDPTDNCCILLSLDIDLHDKGHGHPEANLRSAVYLYEKLISLGFCPILWDSNGAGGFHLDILFAQKVVAGAARRFGLWLCQDCKDFGVEQVEVFPKQDDIKGQFGNFVRLPGKHHKRDHFAKVWNGREWLAGKAAIAHMMSVKPATLDMIPAAATAYLPPSGKKENKHPKDWHGQYKGGAGWAGNYEGDLGTLDLVALFEDEGMLVEAGDPAQVLCPWHENHTTGDGGTYVFENDGAWPGFHCHHAHCEGKDLEAVLAWFGKEKVNTHCEKLFGVVPTGDSADGVCEEATMTAHKEPELPDNSVGTQQSHVPATPKPGKAKKKAADVLVALAVGNCDLWRSDSRQAYVTLAGGKNIKVDSDETRYWLTSKYLTATGSGPGKNALDEAVATLSAIAVCQKPQHKTYLRIARLPDKVVIDLGDDTWQAVEITAQGWKVGKPCVKFVRTDNMAALPVPVKGGTIDTLRRFVNVAPDAIPLVVGSLLDAMKGVGPFIVSIFNGEQGSAKSTALRVMRRLLDPVLKGELAACPKDERDLGCEGENNAIMAFDNISKVPQWLSDALCRVATGGGIKTRKLYKDSEQQIFDICQPVLLNGIEEVASAADLLNRSVQITCEVIAEDRRLPEDEFWRDFENVRAALLGVLYDAVAHGLANFDKVSVRGHPRMADSAKWIAACLPALGMTYDHWREPFEESQDAGIEACLDQSLPAKLLLHWFGERQDWIGTLKDLDEALRPLVPIEDVRYFPKNAQSLSNALRRVAPSLRSSGVHIEKSSLKRKIDGQSKRVIRIRRLPKDHEIIGNQFGNQGASATLHGTLALQQGVEEVAEGPVQMPLGNLRQPVRQPTKDCADMDLRQGCRRLPMISTSLGSEEKEEIKGGKGPVEEGLKSLAISSATFGNLGDEPPSHPHTSSAGAGAGQHAPVANQQHGRSFVPSAQRGLFHDVPRCRAAALPAG